jgi:hypothetical protein
LQWADPPSKCPTDCVKDQETEKAAKAQQIVVEPLLLLLLLLLLSSSSSLSSSSGVVTIDGVWIGEWIY